MRRIRLSFANLQVDFVDRELALRLVEDWGSKGMVKVQVVYGPEGCGKTAWLLQSIEALRGLGFEVIYVNPINKEFVAEVSVTSLRDELIKLAKEALAQNALGRLTWLAFDAAKELIKATKGRIAVIVDDAFQVIDVKESALYVKALLNLIEYPPEHYERIVTIAATSEGLSRHEIGRHRWASLKPMWNMTKDGFERLYEQIPGSKPSFEDVWLLTGGNPKILEELYRVSWRVSELLNDAVESRMLRVFVGNLTSAERMWLWEAVEDPDTLFMRERMLLMNKLVELNLVIDDVPMREDYLWIDQPPPEKDSELGIGKYVAWQTPLHREAVRRALQYT